MELTLEEKAIQAAVLKNSMRVNQADQKMAQEVALGVGLSITEFAIRRAMNGDVQMTKSALASLDLPDPVKFSFMAVACEKAAEDAEARVASQNANPSEGIELRKTSRSFRMASK